MNTTILWRIASLATITLALSSQGLAHPSAHRLGGETSNGNLAGFSGSPVDVQVTGGDTLAASNVTITFGGAAAVHFGDQPLHGVVTRR